MDICINKYTYIHIYTTVLSVCTNIIILLFLCIHTGDGGAVGVHEHHHRLRKLAILLRLSRFRV